MIIHKDFKWTLIVIFSMVFALLIFVGWSSLDVVPSPDTVYIYSYNDADFSAAERQAKDRKIRKVWFYYCDYIHEENLERLHKLPDVEILHFCNVGDTPFPMDVLLKFGTIPNLKEIYLLPEQVEPKDLKQLQQQMPDVKIDYEPTK